MVEMRPAVLKRPFRVAELEERKQAHVSIEANEAERAALAGWLGIPAVRRLRAELDLSLDRSGRIFVNGTLEALVSQTCVVTLEPFDNAVTAPLERIYAPDGQAAAREGEEIEAYSGTSLDLGVAVAEEVSLNLDPYPRKPGVALPEESAADMPGGGRANPFAALAGLRKEKE